MPTFEKINFIMALFIFSIILVYAYTLLILFALRGWLRKDNSEQSEHSFPFCSIVIAARNESKNIGDTISALLLQNYPAECFEILVIDDHSTDNTLELLKQIEQQYENLHVFSAPDDCIGKNSRFVMCSNLQKVTCFCLPTPTAA